MNQGQEWKIPCSDVLNQDSESNCGNTNVIFSAIVNYNLKISSSDPSWVLYFSFTSFFNQSWCWYCQMTLQLWLDYTQFSCPCIKYDIALTLFSYLFILQVAPPLLPANQCLVPTSPDFHNLLCSSHSYLVRGYRCHPSGRFICIQLSIQESSNSTVLVFMIFEQDVCYYEHHSFHNHATRAWLLVLS